MIKLPLHPRLKGSTATNAEFNRQAQRIIDHLHRLIAANPNETQQYEYADLARDLGLSVDVVGAAIAYGGNNGITVTVSDHDRKKLARLQQH